jgi:pimeloyl-ACP methyl ester carboxylesterase
VTPHGTHYRLYEPADGGANLGPPPPLVVLIHGIGDFSEMWAPLAAFLSREKGCRVLTFDFRGRGWSERDGGPADCTAAGHLRQVQQLLAHLQLAATPHHVVAHSMGGIVGALHAADPAAPTTTLTLISPAGALRKHPAGCIPWALKRLCCCLTGCCCVPLLAKKVFNGDPPMADDYDETDGSGGGGGTTAEYLERGRARSRWALVWLRAQAQSPSRRALGNQAFVYSVLHMPFTSVKRTAERMFGPAADRATPVYCLTARGDPTCPDVDVAQYKQMFDRVTHTEWKDGRHCFHQQCAERVFPAIHQFIAGGGIAGGGRQDDAAAQGLGFRV